MMSEKAIEDFIASRNILKINIKLFHDGHRDLYRVIATELRKLLCDGKNSLISRLFSSARFHPLTGYMPKNLKEGLVFRSPSKVEFDGKGGSRIVELFDKAKQPIPVNDWLDQDLFNGKISLRELIRSVADKEAVHADKNYNDTLKFSKGVKLIDEDIHKQHLIAVGEYVLEVMDMAIEINPLLKKRIDQVVIKKTPPPKECKPNPV